MEEHSCPICRSRDFDCISSYRRPKYGPIKSMAVKCNECSHAWVIEFDHTEAEEETVAEVSSFQDFVWEWIPRVFVYIALAVPAYLVAGFISTRHTGPVPPLSIQVLGKSLYWFEACRLVIILIGIVLTLSVLIALARFVIKRRKS